MTSKRRKPIGPKRRVGNGRRARRVVAGSRDSVRQFQRERDEALEQQAATSEILSVISRSPADVRPVLDTIVRAAVKLCNSYDAVILLRDSERLRIAAHYGPIKVDFSHGPINRDWVSGRCVVDRVPVHVHDLAAEGEEFPLGRDISLRLKQHTVLAVPFLRDGEAIGSLTMRRQEVLPFSEKQIALLRTFSAQAVIAIENTRLFEAEQERTRELSQSLEQQTATAEVLKTISSSPGELTPVFDAILESATRLCEAQMGELWLCEGADAPRIVSMQGSPPEWIEFREQHPDLRPGPMTAVGRVRRTKQTIHVTDIKADDSASGDPFRVAFARLVGARTLVAVPMLKDDDLVGIIVIYRMQQRPFSTKQIELVGNFAAQAVIAIENTRLLNELRESLQQQTATADVLKVINRSTFDLAMVLEALVNSAARLCRAQKANIALLRGDIVDYVAQVGFPPDFLKYMQSLRLKLQRGSISGRAALEGKIIHVPDVLADPEYVLIDAQKVGGFRTALGVPMMREGTPIGTMFLSRATVEPFTEQQIELVTTFADQAVIAIENTRLLNELRESLQQQTATADVLKVISRSTFDLQPVLDTLVESATRLCEAQDGVIFVPDGEVFRAAARFGFTPEHQKLIESNPVRIDRGTVSGRAATEGRVVHVADVLTDPEFARHDVQKTGGFRAALGVPLLREGNVIGVIFLSRAKPQPFSEKQIELVTTFADQAVIAIENVRLFDAEQQRTRELSESLEQQTATSKVLDVISRSAFDLQAVFETVVESSVRLCGADRAFIFRFDGELLRMTVAFNNVSQEWKEYLAQHPTRPGRDSAAGRAALERRTVHIPDVQADHEYTFGAKNIEKVRTVLAVPILKGEDLLGVVVIYHLEVRPFTEKQIALVETFADQAAIAIDNVRLLDALRHRTDELGRSVGELRALGEVSQAVNSTLDLETVLSTIVAKAAQLSGTETGAIYGYDEQSREFRLRATYGMDQELIDALTHRHIDLDDPNIAEVFAQREPLQVADLKEEAASELNKIALRAGYRARMVAPLLRGEDIVGMLVVRRRTPGEFAKNTVDIIKTFAAQSALAIQNARLFHEIEDKSRQLEEASQHKSQFLANMSHELRTPLNAILGYTELMADGAYGEPSEKMVSILQRLEANGRHLLGLINDVLDLSKIEAGQLELELSDYSVQDIAQTVRSTLEPLAADKKLAFKVEMARELPAGRGDGRRLTQVLINLVGNAIKFTDAGEVTIKAEANNGSFHVAVRDTGPGISAADQAKLFQEFQQADNAITRKKGGTGLGLAISKRIIEMHGGRIWVESQPGQGSTFAFTLPVIVERQVEAA
jgi:GAF domain-containing protein